MRKVHTSVFLWNDDLDCGICKQGGTIDRHGEMDMSEETEPARVIDPEFKDVLAELIAREPIFHRPEFGTSRADFENMMMPDFWEIGASGSRYSRAFVLEELDKRHSVPHEDVWEATDFGCQRLDDNLYLLTYMLLQNHARLTRRSTIWRHTPSGWKIVFHQGTACSGH